MLAYFAKVDLKYHLSFACLAFFRRLLLYFCLFSLPCTIIKSHFIVIALSLADKKISARRQLFFDNISKILILFVQPLARIFRASRLSPLIMKFSSIFRLFCPFRSLQFSCEYRAFAIPLLGNFSSQPFSELSPKRFLSLLLPLFFGFLKKLIIA